MIVVLLSLFIYLEYFLIQFNLIKSWLPFNDYRLMIVSDYFTLLILSKKEYRQHKLLNIFNHTPEIRRFQKYRKQRSLILLRML